MDCSPKCCKKLLRLLVAAPLDVTPFGQMKRDASMLAYACSHFLSVWFGGSFSLLSNIFSIEWKLFRRQLVRKLADI